METPIFSGIIERGFLLSVILGFSPARQIRKNLAEGIERNENQQDTRFFVWGFVFVFFAFRSFCFNYSPHRKLKTNI